jgi:hypothetical protein
VEQDQDLPFADHLRDVDEVTGQRPAICVFHFDEQHSFLFKAVKVPDVLVKNNNNNNKIIKRRKNYSFISSITLA